MSGSGLALGLIQDSTLSSGGAVNSTPTDYSGYAGIATSVVTTGIELWSSLAQASQQRQMTADLAQYNNSMRAIMQGLKQFSADKNRIAVNDARVNEDQQIDLAKMRAEAQLTTQAAFTGASSSAKRAAMFDVDRNALTAKFNTDAQFENALQQIQLSEYSDEIQAISQTQSGKSYSPSAMELTAGAIGNLASKSIKSGAWDKGSSMRTYFSDLFNNSSAKLPE